MQVIEPLNRIVDAFHFNQHKPVQERDFPSHLIISIPIINSQQIQPLPKIVMQVQIPFECVELVEHRQNPQSLILGSCLILRNFGDYCVDELTAGRNIKISVEKSIHQRYLLPLSVSNYRILRNCETDKSNSFTAKSY